MYEWHSSTAEIQQPQVLKYFQNRKNKQQISFIETLNSKNKH
jgi:hypothetical protein